MSAGKNLKARRVSKILKQLQDLEMEILFGENQGGPDNDLPMDTVDELKSVVDSLRASIWCYIQSRREHANESVAELTSHYRMRRVVEMLRQARVSRPATPTQNFGLEGLELMSEQAVKSYLS